MRWHCQARLDPAGGKGASRGVSFEPCRPTIGNLPIQPHVFMHSFHAPEDHTGSLIIEGLPKKLGVELSRGNDPYNLPVGWGIYIIEGYNWKLITCWAGLFIFWYSSRHVNRWHLAGALMLVSAGLGKWSANPTGDSSDSDSRL